MHLSLTMPFVIQERTRIIIVILRVVQSALPMLFKVNDFTFISIRIRVCYDADACTGIVGELSLIFVAIGLDELASSMHLSINHLTSEATSIRVGLFNDVTANNIVLIFQNFDLWHHGTFRSFRSFLRLI